MSKRLTCIALVIAMFLLFPGCGKKEQSSVESTDQVLKNYMTAIQEGRPGDAYEMLSEVNKKSYSKDDFILRQKLISEIKKSENTVGVSKANEYQNKSLEGNTFNAVTEYKVHTITEYYKDNQKVDDTYSMYVVSDNGSIKVYRQNEDIKKKIADLYCRVGDMYRLGQGKDKSLAVATDYYNKASSYDTNCEGIYSGQGMVYFESQKYNDAIGVLKTGIDKSVNNQYKSDAYGLLGLCYMNLNDSAKGNECYNKALELNPDNTNVKQLKESGGLS